MDGRNSGAANSSLSQYFTDDPPSFFDELAHTQIAREKATTSAPPVPPPRAPPKSQMSPGNLTASTFNGVFIAPDYIENPVDAEDEIRVADSVRNFWEPQITEPWEQQLPLTTPGIQSPNDLPDIISEAVVKHLGEADLSQRKILGVDNVTQDAVGLRTLINAGCYRAAVNLTGQLLTIYGQGYGRAGQPAKHSPHSLQLWFTRLALLAKLGEYKLLQKEAEPFDQLNGPDIFYEFYPEMHEGKKGSIACFSFRLLLAEIPIYLGNAQLALDRISKLYVICHDIKTYFARRELKDAEHFWRRREIRTLHALINCALVLKKFNLIDDIIRDMILGSTDSNKEERRALYSAWGRIYLQIGDVFGAEQKFAEARRMREINSTPDLRDLVDKGLITVAENDFRGAYTIFQKALHLETGNTMILNNMGVCLLYEGKLKEAIKLFETAINLNPQKSLNESLLINLSTLYELESSNSKIKKLNLLRLISQYKPDLSIGIEICLKLQATN